MNRSTRIAGGVLLLLALGSLVVPALSPYDYYTPHLALVSQSPTWRGGHLLGTDPLGRDLLIRVLWGCRISLLIALAASSISVVVGVLWGAVAGYVGGRVDTLMMRLVDVLYSVPFVPFVIVLTVLFGHALWLMFVAIGAVSWLDIARIVRGETLSLKRREFVEAARVAGVRGARMIARHIVPNLLGVVIIYATLTVPTVILFEAFMSFLGLGVRVPLASLGSLIADGASDMQAHPHLLLVPATVLAVIVYCFNFLGDGLRDLLDPRQEIMSGQPLLQLRDLGVRYHTSRGSVDALRGIDLELKAGECLGLVGESGSGKTALLLAIMGLLPARTRLQGSIRYRGTELIDLAPSAFNAVRGARIAMVFQDPMSALNPYLRVGDQLSEVARVHGGSSRHAAEQRALELLQAVHIGEPERRARQYPHQLSGGMRQRVMIAMALMAEPEIILADEPTTALDVTVQAQILALLRELRAHTGAALLLVTHDLGVVAQLADRVGVMRDGRLLELADCERLFAQPQHSYTQQLLAAMPRLSVPA